MPQSLSNILIHTIFSTKHRKPFIYDEIRTDLYNYMSGIARSHEAFVYEIGGVEDHVHLLTSLPRTKTISQLVEDIKKGSSKWLKTKGNKYMHFAWQNGYGAFSIGQSNFDALGHYIQNQKEHHKQVSFREEYLLFLKQYKVQYDEKYLWD